MDTKELKTLFPAREVVLSDGKTKVMVTPLSLENLPKVADSFGILMKHAEQGGIGPSEIAAKALGEVLKIVPYCISIPAKEVPSYDVPDILEIVVEQNVTEDVVGKWMGLVEKLLVVSGQGSLVEAIKKEKATSPNSLQKV
jgi:hypothetical protein